MTSDNPASTSAGNEPVRVALPRGDLRGPVDAHLRDVDFVVEGEGAMQWYDDAGAMHEKPVKAGDAIYMPRDCDSHRIFNSGSSMLRVLYGGTPPAKITKV